MICIVICYPSKLYLLTMFYRLYSYRVFRMMIVMEMMITWILSITGKDEEYSSNKLDVDVVMFPVRKLVMGNSSMYITLNI